MKPHESPRIRKKSICGDSWPVWNRGITVDYRDPQIHSEWRLVFKEDLSQTG